MHHRGYLRERRLLGNADGVFDAPSAVCLSTTQSETYDTMGSCSAGACAYTSHTTTCAAGTCSGGLCTVDPCNGITCNTPPSGCYSAPGMCTAGSCSYPFDNGVTCNDGNACTTNDQCTSGVCKGTRLACNTPPANVCVSAVTLKAYSSAGKLLARHVFLHVLAEVLPWWLRRRVCVGAGWHSMTSNTTQSLRSVWGASATSVWAVGQGGTIVHFDGLQWQVQALPAAAKGALLTAVHGTAVNNVFAIAETTSSAQLLLRFNGLQWSVAATISGNGPTCNYLSGGLRHGQREERCVRLLLRR